MHRGSATGRRCSPTASPACGSSTATGRRSDSELITIGLAQGDALGGGFESLLSFDVLVAEKGAKFGFPEQLFGLFPGMGALTFMGRKLGFAKAEQLIRSASA